MINQFLIEHIIIWLRARLSCARSYRRYSLPVAPSEGLRRAEQQLDEQLKLARLGSLGQIRAQTVAETLYKAEQLRVEQLLAPWRDTCEELTRGL